MVWSAVDGGDQFTIPVVRSGVVVPTYAAGHTIVGGCVSSSVTWNPHVPVFPTVSVAEHVTLLVPYEKMEPDAGEHEDVDTPTGSLNVNDHVSDRVLAFNPRLSTMFEGQNTLGGWLSTTFTLKLHDATFPALSFAVHEITVVPTAK